mmetsp:Transcript_3861/g.14999  ORF Transcript_3861/g.14999 Transcript_3861/m.14999 type:complete len:157 (-) Transcript_3861:102-572(-)
MKRRFSTDYASLVTAAVFCCCLQLWLVLPDLGTEVTRGVLPLLPILLSLAVAIIRRLRLSWILKAVAGATAFYIASALVLAVSDKARDALLYLHWVRVPLMVDLSRPQFSLGLHGVRSVTLTHEDGTEINFWHFVPPRTFSVRRLPHQWPKNVSGG